MDSAFFATDEATVLLEAIVGGGRGRATDSVSGSQTIISPGPRWPAVAVCPWLGSKRQPPRRDALGYTARDSVLPLVPSASCPTRCADAGDRWFASCTDTRPAPGPLRFWPPGCLRTPPISGRERRRGYRMHPRSPCRHRCRRRGIQAPSCPLALRRAKRRPRARSCTSALFLRIFGRRREW